MRLRGAGEVGRPTTEVKELTQGHSVVSEEARR